MLRVAIALFMFIITTTSVPALADEWSHTTALESATTASLRVVEPEGYQVTVNGHTDAAPAVFTVPNADSYVLLSVRAPSGANWERKIEIKAYRQTVVRIRHVKIAPEKPAGARRASYVGVLANTTHLCKAAERRDIRIEFVLGADVIKAVEVAVRSRVDAELPGGEYRIRRFRRSGTGWEFAATQNLTVDKDGWIYHWGC